MRTSIKCLAMMAVALVAGVTSVSAQDEEGDELTADNWSLYDGTGKDAQKVDGTIYNWDWQIGTGISLGGGAVLAGTTTVQETAYADLSEYSTMVIYGEIGNGARLMFNRMEANGQAADGKMIEIYKTVGEDGEVTLDLKNEMLRGVGDDKTLDDFAHLVTIKVPWGQEAQIDAILLFKGDDPTAIQNVTEAANDVVVATYNVAGEKVSADTKGLVIKKLQSGKVVKFVNK